MRLELLRNGSFAVERACLPSPTLLGLGKGLQVGRCRQELMPDLLEGHAGRHLPDLLRLPPILSGRTLSGDEHDLCPRGGEGGHVRAAALKRRQCRPHRFDQG